MTHFFNLTPGTDNFTGVSNDYNAFQLDATTLQSTDTVTGGATGSFFDVILVTAAGTITASQFAGVTNIEQINLSSAGGNISLSNGLVAGTSTGFFTILDGGGNDTVNASAVSTKPVVFYAAGGADAFTGGGGNDSFVFATTDLTSADTVQGGGGTDNLYFSTAGTVAASAFTNVSGIEGIGLSSLGNNITLTNSLVAGSGNGSFAVSDGAGNDTVDASGVTNGGTIAFFASAGSDTFRGGNGANGYVFAASDLTSADTVQGGSGVDNLFISTAGTLGASAFTNVTNIEALVLANGTNNVTLTNSLVAGTSIGYFSVAGGTGNDTVDASGVTNGTAIAFYGTTGGNDTFTGGNGTDSFLFAAGQLTAADTVVGGGGNDTLWMTTAGTTTTAALANVTGIEGVFLQAGGTFNLANGITTAASFAAVGSSAVDTFDASAVTGYKVAFTGNGGADVLKGGTQDDTFFIADSAFATINGNGGIDRITLTAASQSFNLTANAAKITNLEVIDLNSALNSTLTLAGTDIAQINSASNSLYVVGDTDDTVNAGNGWTQIASGVINNAVAPGHTFFEYQHSTGSLLFIDTAITSLTATSGTGSTSVAEGFAAGTTAFNAQQSGATTYVLGGADAALFSIDGTGHISFNASPNFETPLDSGANNVYDLTVTSSNGTATPNFVEDVHITVTNVAPSTPVDSDGGTADSVAEGAAVGTYTGVTASSTDVNGPAVTWSLAADTSGGGFSIGADGKIKVADASKINYETATHSYDVTAQASDGSGGTSSHLFTIGVTNTNPSTPTDSDSGTANSVVEGAAVGTYTGLTAASADVNGPTVTWLLTADSSGGAFGIGADGKVTVVDPSFLDFESTGPGHTYSVTAQASDTAGGTASASFNITVTNANPSTPVDSDTGTPDTVDEGAAVGTYTGVTAAATDPGNNPVVSWTLTADTSGGGFTIGADGKIKVADASKINYETATHSYDVTAQASDGSGGTSSHLFTIAVGDVAPSTPVDSDGAANQVFEHSVAGTYTGVTASSTDVNGPAVTWSLTNDTSGGGFTIDSTGKITVADSSKITGSPNFTVTAQASAGTLNSTQDFVITVQPNTAPTANADSLSATEKGGVNNATGGSNPSGNVITGTGGATADTDAETPGSLTVISFGTGSSGGTSGVVDGSTQLTGDHGSLTLAADGTFHYFVNQTDPAVQALVPASTALTDTFHYTIQDPGGLTSTAVITVSISGANDLPGAVADTGTMSENDAPTTFTVRGNDSLDPDTGAANTVAPGSVTVTGTPAGTTFVNSDATAAAVNSSQDIQVTLGAAFQQLHAGETATVNVPYTLTGNAGETSSTTLTVTVNGANDVTAAQDDTGSMTEDQSPTAFNVLGNDTLDPDHGAPTATTVGTVTTGAVSNLSAPSGENIDTGDIGVSVDANNKIVVTLGSDFQNMKQGESTTFDVAYTLHGDQVGDSSNATLHVTVNGVNDAPVAQDFNFSLNSANNAIGNTSLVLDDTSVPGAPDPAGPQKVINGSLLTGATDVDGPNALATSAVTNQATSHGHVTINTAGEFSYTPNAGYIGTDTFTYTITDGNTPTAGTDTGQVTVNVATPKVWYVNADAGTDGDGTSANPFNTLSHFAGVGGVDGAGDTIFLYNATNHYTGGLTLENNEKLVGQDVGLTVNGTTLETATNVNGAIVDGGVVLGSGDTISGVTLGNTSAGGTALSGTNFGTFNVDHTVVNTNNNGMILNTGAFGAGSTFTSFTSSGATDVSLTNVTGSVDLGTGTMAGQFTVSGGSVSTTYAGNLSQANNASMVDVSGGHTGTLTFNTGTLNATNGTGLQFSNADGTYNFNGTTTLNGGNAGIDILAGGDAANGSQGTFSFGSNTSITSPTGTALNIDASNAAVTYGGTITQNNAANAVSVTNEKGTHTVDINGLVTANTSTATGVNITGNSSGTAVQFDGGLNIDTTTGTGFNASGAGTVHVTATAGDESINSTGGAALNLSGMTVDATGLNFDSTNSGGGTNNVNLSSVTGTGAINLGSGALSGATGVAFNVSGGTGNVDYNGSIAKTSDGRVIDVQNHTAGSLSFDGTVSSTSASDGIHLSGNTNATIGFSNTLTLNTSASGTNAFDASGGGTVTATNASNSINSGAGIGLNVSGTTIGAGGMIFHDISSSGAASGIILNNTGSGGLSVTGTSSGSITATGGTITGSTGSGVSLTNASNVSLNHMTVSNSGDDGITGSTVTGFTLANSTISGNGNAANTDHGLDFTNLLGTSSITNTHLTNNQVDQARVQNSTGTATVTFDGVLFQSTGLASAPNGEHGLLFDTHSTGSADLNVKNSTFNNLFSNSIDILNDGTGTLETTINNNTFTNVGASGITIAQQNPDSGGAGIVRFYIHDNGTAGTPTFLRGTNTGSSNSININQADNNTHSTGGVLEGQISNNFIGNNSSTTSASTGGSGITVSSVAPGTTTVQIDHNTIQGEGADGIAATMGEDTNPAHTMNLTIFNNSATVSDVNSFDGIFIEGGVLTGDKGTLRLDMHDNTASSVSGSDFTLRQRFLTTDQLLNYGGANNDNAAVQTYLDVTKNNTAVHNTWFITNNVSGGGGGFVNTASVPTPTLPSPQLALHGQGPGSSQTLSMDELTPILAIAIQHWADAGASAAQIAQLEQATSHITITDMATPGVLAETDWNGITIDSNAAGWGWFIDPTPKDNSEFTATGSPNELLASGGDAAGHMDLLTVVEHELGHIIGLGDSNAAGVMNVDLDVGERRLPDTTDVAAANASDAVQAELALPVSAQAASGAPTVVGTAGNDTIDAGHGGNILFGGAGADTFVFGSATPLDAPTPAQVTHVADYHAAEGDRFDFSAITSAFHNSNVSDSLVVRAVEDASGKFATLQVDHIDPMGLPSAPNWVNVAQLDGAHAGDAVNVLIDNHSVHLAQIHVDLLA
jgi:VCBS repeat-containing protein